MLSASLVFSQVSLLCYGGASSLFVHLLCLTFCPLFSSSPSLAVLNFASPSVDATFSVPLVAPLPTVFFLLLFSSSVASQLSLCASPPQLPTRVPRLFSPYEPPNRHTVIRLSYHNIMRLGAPKLKEAIFYSCQLIIEGGPTYSSTFKGS